MLECNRSNICISTGALVLPVITVRLRDESIKKNRPRSPAIYPHLFGRHTTEEQLDKLLHTFTALWEQKKGELDIDRRIKAHGRQQA